MYRPDHPPAHFHAEYGGHWAKINIATGEPIAGDLPARALRFVREWAELHQLDLDDNWNRAQALEPLVPIDPLP